MHEETKRNILALRYPILIQVVSIICMGAIHIHNYCTHPYQSLDGWTEVVEFICIYGTTCPGTIIMLFALMEITELKIPRIERCVTTLLLVDYIYLTIWLVWFFTEMDDYSKECIVSQEQIASIIALVIINIAAFAYLAYRIMRKKRNKNKKTTSEPSETV